MKIRSARFVKSARQLKDFPRDLRPEVAFCGRSNVGKSSLLNVLTDSRGLARTSSTPGRTQSINFFLVDDSLYFVDLPGYGYARVSKRERERWGELLEGYLAGRRELKLVLLLVDSRVPPMPQDAMMKQWLDHHGVPNCVVLMKTDKLTKNQLNQALRRSAATLNTKEILTFSAVTGAGRDTVLHAIRMAVAQDPTT